MKTLLCLMFVLNYVYVSSYSNMQLITVKETKVVKLDEVLTTNNQIAFFAWKQGNKLDKGTWGVYLVSPPYFLLEIAEFEYNGNEKPGWNRIVDYKWVDIPIDGILEFSLLLRAKNIKKGPVLSYNFPKNWMYKFFIKTKEED